MALRVLRKTGIKGNLKRPSCSLLCLFQELKFDLFSLAVWRRHMGFAPACVSEGRKRGVSC
jgi:hypothetical protein